MARRTKLAIFDIDGTVFRSSLFIELFYELVRRGVFPPKAERAVHAKYLAWLNRKGHYNDYLYKMVKVHYRYLEGCTPQQVEPVVRSVIAYHQDRVYRFTRNLVHELKRKGYFLIAISNSQEDLVKRFTDKLGFDAAIGRITELVNGVYTGRVLVEGRPFPITSHVDKISILNRLIASRKLNVDLKKSIMVGDSEGDLPLLSYVGRPIAFNPSTPLARIARKRGWRIVVERKDVVYDIKDASLIPVAERQRVTIPYGPAKK